MSTVQDDFLSQVQETEAKAASLIQKAQEKQRKDLEKENQSLVKTREASFGKMKEEGKKLHPCLFIHIKFKFFMIRT